MSTTTQDTKKLDERLLAVQVALKAPKSQYNNFGKYHYRNCEDILEALKPLLKEQGLLMRVWDEVELIGDRFYVKATVHVQLKEEWVSTTAYAREADTKKGMDESQITGAASSYARKYALNGMFAIDDTKDADSDEHRSETRKAMDEQKVIVNTVNTVMNDTNAPTSKQLMAIKTKLSILKTEPEARDKVMSQIRTSKQASDLIKQLDERIVNRSEVEG